ncbi:MAG: nucleoside transporter C-terminal domain-containing protein [Balneolaceae bacterium]|nr:nucleoside transporter C-terminal domain-containing protein [Balneolaceae bacterium]
MIDIVRGAIGMASIVAFSYAVSNNRNRVDWRLVGTGLAIQFVLALLIIKGDPMAELWAPLGWPKAFFSWLSSFFVIVLDFTTEGAVFLFGDLAKSPGAEGSLGNFFAFQVLPTIIFFASLTAVLYHYGLLQRAVKYMARGMQKIMGTSGAESLSVISNIFVGQTEAPLVIKPFIAKLTQSELLAVMTGGMATIAGGVMAAYVQMLGSAYAQAQGVSLDVGRLMFAEHLLGASLMAAPAALVIAKILYPEDGNPETMGDVDVHIEARDANGIDAAANGAATGLKLAANVGAMLLAFIALLAMGNYFLEHLGAYAGINSLIPGGTLRIETILGWMTAPVAWIIGVPWSDAIQMGSLIGTKIVLNEFVAYLQLADLIETSSLMPKTVTMATFALCGFANFSSIAIQIGGIGGLAPGRKSELAQFGLKAVAAGTLANLMTATIAGILY